MILMIDNYDSFVYNLVQYLMSLNEEVAVYRNDALTIEAIKEMNPEMIVLSPGPCTPNESGICQAVVSELTGVYPILGICLGHQTIGQVFGGKVIQALRPVHGKVEAIEHTNNGVFRNLNQPLNVTRYHSLVIERETLPECFEITAWSREGEIMGIKHKTQMLEGVQFHPEAILTDQGLQLLENFLIAAKGFKKGGIGYVD